MRNSKIASRFKPYARDFWRERECIFLKSNPALCRTDGIFAVRTANRGYHFDLLEPETVTIGA